MKGIPIEIKKKIRDLSHKYNISEIDRCDLEKSLLKEFTELQEEKLDLRKRYSVIAGFAPYLHRCNSCDSYYAEGYVCSCGFDNSKGEMR